MAQAMGSGSSLQSSSAAGGAGGASGSKIGGVNVDLGGFKLTLPIALAGLGAVGLLVYLVRN